MFTKQATLSPRLPESPIFPRFTPSAVKVIKLAQKEGRRLGHNFVGTEQILVGLIEEGNGTAASVLKSAGVTLKAVRAEIEKIIGRGNRIKTVGIPFAPRAKLLLEAAVESADDLGHFYVDTENLLIGMLWVGEGVAITVLQTLGIDLEALQQKVLEVAPRGAGLAASSEMAAKNPQPAVSNLDYWGDAPTTDFTSAEVSARFCALLFSWVEPRRLGRVIADRTEFNLPDGEVMVPRIAFVLAQRLKRVPRTYPDLPPDLVVEIKSAFNQLAPLQEKIQQFMQQGVQVGLLINPDDCSVTVYRSGSAVALQTGDSLTLPDLLPGWELPIADLWSPVFED